MSTNSPGIKRNKDRDEVMKAVQRLVDVGDDVLSTARELIKDSVDTFVDEKIGVLFKLALAYNTCFQSLEIKTKSDLEHLTEKFYSPRYPDFRDLIDDWLDIEQQWDDLLKNIDKKINHGDDKVVHVGEEGPVDVSLVNAKTGDTTTIRNYLGKQSIILVGLRHFA